MLSRLTNIVVNKINKKDEVLNYEEGTVKATYKIDITLDSKKSQVYDFYNELEAVCQKYQSLGNVSRISSK